MREKEQLGNRYDFERTFKTWQAEHCALSLLGVLLDVLAGNGPRLSALLSGVSFCRLFLKLAEKHEPQVWTLPNLVTALRIAGVVAAALLAGPTTPPQQKPERGAALAQPPGADSGLEDWAVCLLGAGFVAMDLLDGWLARKLAQQTALGAELDGLGDALGTGWLALTLLNKGRLPGLFALHLASAPYLWPLANALLAGQREQPRPHAKHPWARPAAGAMALFALLAVALPAAFASSAPPTAGLGSRHLPTPLNWPPALPRVEALAWGCATLAGLVNVASFGLSYLTLFGVKIPGNGLGEKHLGHEHSK